MKKVFLLIVLLSCTSVLASEIKLKTDSASEPTLNLVPANREQLMQSSSQDLKQGPVILQNSISPATGVPYKSDRILKDPEDNIQLQRERE